MAVPSVTPYEDVGTATVIAGQVAVVGQGTRWSRCRKGDTFYGQAGERNIVADIADDTHLTLRFPATVPQAALGVAIMRTPDDVFTQTMARDVFERITKSVFVALAGVAATARKAIRFDANAIPETFDFSDKAVELAGKENQADMRGVLGAQADLGYTPVNKAGDTMKGNLLVDVPLINNQDAYVALGSIYQGNLNGVGLRYQIDGSGLNSSYLTSWAVGVPFNNARLSYGVSRFYGNFEVIANHAVNAQAEVRLGSFYRGAFYGLSMRYMIDSVGAVNRYIVFTEDNNSYYIAKIDISKTTYYGHVAVNGTLSKGGGTFLIDHPLDPANKDLAHGFVEAPGYGLVYWGKVRLIAGRATVNIDLDCNTAHPLTQGTFAALTINATVHALQNLDGFARLRPSPIAGASFEIICEDNTCSDEVAWLVVAERNDPFVRSNLDPNTDENGRFVPEREKEAA